MAERGRITPAGEPVSRRVLLRKGIVLEVLTILWNVVEAGVALVAGALAGSIALVGFGVDSVIEVTAGLVVLWRLATEGEEGDERSERAERIALFVVGLSFLGLAAYITGDAAWTLVRRIRPAESLAGIVLAALSLVVMPILAWAKRRVGRRLGSAALVADATETAVCAWLSFTLLLGLGLNWAFGIWWADPVAALLMVPLLLREGWEAVRGEDCTH